MARGTATSSIASHREPLLLYLLLLSLGAAQSRSNLPPCEPEQALALLRLKATFPVTNHSASPACALGSWPAGADCCRWDGVRCGYVVPRYTTGTVVFLDLSNCVCGPGKEKVPLDAVALLYLPSLRHVDRACDNDGFINGSSSSSKLKLPPQVNELGFIQLKPRNLNSPRKTQQGPRKKK
ncbi:LOW QUALITY PROTEIN: hypothetical protein SETIT_5G113800v2 [Setaria italica]|uniref:Leucine-rich repeat-containing N-terminal plant-type domain-containing protein n=1 Tax=Setaria italica TaxID=4555 RepID=A0A368R3Z2_SETIT|nr:LOW QUALITY PROTEIN: hypothetical protein SETIT_5G113800v2 [Setaria italica]